MKEQYKPILNMLKCINEGKMTTATKYLEEAVALNLKNRIKKALKKSEK